MARLTQKLTEDERLTHLSPARSFISSGRRTTIFDAQRARATHLNSTRTAHMLHERAVLVHWVGKLRITARHKVVRKSRSLITAIATTLMSSIRQMI